MFRKGKSLKTASLLPSWLNFLVNGTFVDSWHLGIVLVSIDNIRTDLFTLHPKVEIRKRAVICPAPNPSQGGYIVFEDIGKP